MKHLMWKPNFCVKENQKKIVKIKLKDVKDKMFALLVGLSEGFAEILKLFIETHFGLMNLNLPETLIFNESG